MAGNRAAIPTIRYPNGGKPTAARRPRVGYLSEVFGEEGGDSRPGVRRRSRVMVGSGGVEEGVFGALVDLDVMGDAVRLERRIQLAAGPGREVLARIGADHRAGSRNGLEGAWVQAVEGRDDLEARIGAGPGDRIGPAEAEADRPEPMGIDLGEVAEVVEGRPQLDHPESLERAGHHSGHHPEHADRTVATAEKVDGQGRVADFREAPADAPDVVVEPVGLVDDDHARAWSRRLRQGQEGGSLLTACGERDVLASHPFRTVSETPPLLPPTIFEMTIKFGALIPQGWRMDLADIPDPVAKYEAMSSAAREAEAAGYASAWLYDHLHTVPTPELESVFECWTSMAALARDTKTIRLGQIVTCNSYRPPALLAKMAAGIDVMSGGRLIVGMGAGWYEHEYNAYGYDFPSTPDRLRMLREALKIMRMMWTEDRPVFTGKHYRIDGPICEPKPVQDPLPLWIGGSGEQVTLKLVAQHGDACNVGGDPETLGRKFAILRGHCETSGRDYESITRSSNVPVIHGDAAEVTRIVADTVRRTGATEEYVRTQHVVGDARAIAAALRARAEAGVQYFIVYQPNGAEPGAWKRFAEEVIPLVAG